MGRKQRGDRFALAAAVLPLIHCSAKTEFQIASATKLDVMEFRRILPSSLPGKAHVGHD
jgi:hypothetical protein